MQIESLWKYPIKGVGGNSIRRTTLSVDQTLPGDRRYALSAKSLKAAQADDGVWLQKAHFLQLMQTEALAALRCRLDGDIMTIHGTDSKEFEGNLAIPDDRAKCQKFIANFLQLADPAMLRIHQIENGAFTDQPEQLISIGGSASLEAFAAATHTKADARRFRLNITVATTAAFAENQWGSAKLQMGEAVIQIVDNVERCAAINVDPVSATRESDHLVTMRQAFGHSYLGVFGRVISPGVVQCGDSVSFINSD
jgi:uncharacterized protein YcbX